MPTCAMGSVAVRRVLAPLPGSGMRRGGRQLCRHFDFFHPLGNKAGICPPPPALPSCPSHGDGSGGGGGQSWEMPHSWAVRAGAEDGVHGCTHVAHPVPVAPSPRHREAHGMPIPVLSSPQYRHPAQPLLSGTRSGAEQSEGCVAHPSPGVLSRGAAVGPCLRPAGLGPAEPPGAAREV